SKPYPSPPPEDVDALRSPSPDPNGANAVSINPSTDTHTSLPQRNNVNLEGTSKSDVLLSLMEELNDIFGMYDGSEEDTTSIPEHKSTEPDTNAATAHIPDANISSSTPLHHTGNGVAGSEPDLRSAEAKKTAKAKKNGKGSRTHWPSGDKEPGFLTNSMSFWRDVVSLGTAGRTPRKQRRECDDGGNGSVDAGGAVTNTGKISRKRPMEFEEDENGSARGGVGGNTDETEDESTVVENGSDNGDDGPNGDQQVVDLEADESDGTDDPEDLDYIETAGPSKPRKAISRPSKSREKKSAPSKPKEPQIMDQNDEMNENDEELRNVIKKRAEHLMASWQKVRRHQFLFNDKTFFRTFDIALQTAPEGASKSDLEDAVRRHYLNLIDGRVPLYILDFVMEAQVMICDRLKDMPQEWANPPTKTDDRVPIKEEDMKYIVKIVDNPGITILVLKDAIGVSQVKNPMTYSSAGQTRCSVVVVFGCDVLEKMLRELGRDALRMKILRNEHLVEEAEEKLEQEELAEIATDREDLVRLEDPNNPDAEDFNRLRRLITELIPVCVKTYDMLKKRWKGALTKKPGGILPRPGQIPGLFSASDQVQLQLPRAGNPIHYSPEERKDLEDFNAHTDPVIGLAQYALESQNRELPIAHKPALSHQHQRTTTGPSNLSVNESGRGGVADAHLDFGDVHGSWSASFVDRPNKILRPAPKENEFDGDFLLLTYGILIRCYKRTMVLFEGAILPHAVSPLKHPEDDKRVSVIGYHGAKPVGPSTKYWNLANCPMIFRPGYAEATGIIPTGQQTQTTEIEPAGQTEGKKGKGKAKATATTKETGTTPGRATKRRKVGK
ncbi:hypothetical protein HDV00_005051, partial [Rhizophlyctis rosea]